MKAKLKIAEDAAGKAAAARLVKAAVYTPLRVGGCSERLSVSFFASVHDI